MSVRTSLLVSVLIGVSLEVLVAAYSGRREAWDSGLYWSVGLPLAALAAGLVGYAARARAWWATWAIIPGQTAAMIVRSGDIGTLWPLTIALSAILSAPLVLVAWAGSRLRPPGRRA